MRRVLRLVFITYTVLRFGLDELALAGFKQRWVRALSWTVTLGRRYDQPRGVRLRQALERHLRENPQDRGALQVVPAFRAEVPA